MYNYGLNREFKRLKWKKEIYIVEFSSQNYCGASEHCAVMTTSEEEAIELASDYAEDFFYQEDNDQIEEENDGEEPEGIIYATMGNAVRLIGSEFEEYYADPVQRENFYPMVG